MRIVHIAAGAGEMYCGACARDIALVRGLLARGHDVLVLPLYTPLRLDTDAGVPLGPLFYGGINVYLQQLSTAFRRLPAPLTRALDHPTLLNWVSRVAVSTRAEDLGAMTVSVLAGRDGRQAQELARVLDFLEHIHRPEVVSITNSLLAAIAPEIKRRLGIPIVCALQGEDGFVAAMPAPYPAQVRTLLRRHTEAIDRFIAPGQAYATRMAAALDVPPDRIAVIRPGVEMAQDASAPRRRDPFTIGYLSVITHGKGLDLLIAAVRDLVAQGRDVRLQVAGKALNARYARSVRATIRAAGLDTRVALLGEIAPADKATFLRQCSLFVLPTRQEEARGMAVLEAMAAGVPVVVPAAGIFPEVIAHTGGGLLVPPEDVPALIAAIARLQDEPELADTLGQQAARGIATHFSADQQAAAMENVLTALTRAVAAG